MPWRQTENVEEYAAAVSAFLEAEPSSRNVVRWIIQLARRGVGGWSAPPVFWWLADDRGVHAAASWTPPYNLHITALPDAAAAELVEMVRARAALGGQRVAGVGGPRRAAENVAAAWQEATGVPGTLQMAQLLHELTDVQPVPQPPGSRRVASAADLDELATWLLAFASEVGVPTGVDPRATMNTLVSDGHCHLWTLDGVSVSMAARREPIAAVVRVGPVYTPPEHRTRGYATRLVAELSAAALAEPGVQRCMLYTDADNPVSNSIYRRIGYRAVEEHAEYSFGAG